ncbi:hypothetical protein C8J56DRAFT_943933 [Mycena floridula]|nr:hypothetical protein C8J56DRAFT_943933 [Mycena floridula]
MVSRAITADPTFRNRLVLADSQHPGFPKLVMRSHFVAVFASHLVAFLRGHSASIWSFLVFIGLRRGDRNGTTKFSMIFRISFHWTLMSVILDTVNNLSVVLGWAVHR